MKTLLRILVPVQFRFFLQSSYRRIRYFGFNYKCPFCHHTLRRFLPGGLKLPVFEEKKIVGGGFREKHSCPVCGTTDRDRLMYIYLRHVSDLLSGKRSMKVLHVAPEKSIQRLLKGINNIDYISGDINRHNAMVKMDITNIQYPDNSFDVIICNHVLEHIPDDNKAMRELHRVLKSGGWAILQVPIAVSSETTDEDSSVTDPKGRERRFCQHDHVRLYGRDYISRLNKAGFKAEKYNLEKKFPQLVEKYGVNSEEEIYIARK